MKLAREGSSHASHHSEDKDMLGVESVLSTSDKGSLKRTNIWCEHEHRSPTQIKNGFPLENKSLI